MSLVSITKISSPMLASVAEQASLSLTRSETPEDRFSHEEAHMYTMYVCTYSQSFVYCRVFVFLIIDYSTKKCVLIYSRKCSSEIVNFRSNPYRKQGESMC